MELMRRLCIREVGRVEDHIFENGICWCEQRAAPFGGSTLPLGPGSELWKYWTTGKGFGRWAGAAKKWTTLHRLLLKAGVPPRKAKGLTTNIIEATMPWYLDIKNKKP